MLGQSLADHEAIVAAFSARDADAAERAMVHAYAERPSLDARRHGQDRMTKARIGVIGAGWWAVANHIPVLKSIADCEIVAVNRLGESRA